MKFIALTVFAILFTSISHAQFAVADTLIRLDFGVKGHVLADVDNDGDHDLIVADNNGLGWYENEGGESFGDKNIIIDGDGGKVGVYTADFNGDGYMDFSGGYRSGGMDYYSTFLNNEDGTFDESIHKTGSFLESFTTLFDDDGDGDYDYFYSNTSGGLSRFPGNPDGTFGAEEVIHDGAYNYYQVYHTDFDNDGDEDLLMCTQDPTIKFSYLENLGGGIYAAPEIVLDDMDGRPIAGTFGDLDGDGDEDWVIGTGFEYHALRYYENEGASLAAAYDFGEFTSSGITLGDLDLDGLLDVVGGYSKSQHKWMRNNGDGTFEEGVNLPMDIWAESGVLEELKDVEVHDFDGDGDLEVYAEMTQDYYYYVRYTNLIISDYQATGRFYADLNENGVEDDDEVGLSFPEISSDPSPDAAYVGADGDYFVGFEIEDDITYTITPVLPDNWAISSADEDYEVLIDGVTVWEDLDFGIYPTVLIDSIHNNLVGAFPRCNDTINYWVSIQNEGTTIASGLIDLELADSLTYVSASIPTDSIVEQHVYFHYDSLLWFEEFQFSVQVQTPDFLSEGDTVISHLITTVKVDDATVYTEDNSLSQIITCAYDPNDKVSFPLGVDEAGFISDETEFIEYTIRFQNTGSDTAFNIVITDQLDDNFDWDSFLPLTSSHAMTSEIDVDGEITFTFDNIMLPDSNVNVLESQGYVKYRVNIDEALDPGTVLENDAEIYFDLNPPILTNTTVNTLFNCETILSNVALPSTVCFGDSIIGTTDGPPIPSTTIFNWNLDDEEVTGDDFYALLETAGVYTITVTASTDFCEASEVFVVEVLPEILPTELSPIYICAGDSALVFDEYESVATTYTLNMETETGCDSLVTIDLVVLELPIVAIESLEDATLCLDEGAIDIIATPSGGTYSGIGMTGGTFDPVMAGEGEFMIYYSYEDDSLCQATDSVMIAVVDCLGLNNESESAIARILPNPFNTATTVTFRNFMDGSQYLVIYDLIGQEVRRINQISGQSVVINRDNLTPGVYILSLQNGNSQQMWSEKLIVE